jgi:biopolymer transport protein ExbD
MAMSVGNAGGGVMCDINTTPLIDVMLVLLVTLIVSLPIMTHAVKLDMPQNNNPPPPDQRPEVIDLRPDRRAKYDYVAKVLAAAQRNRMKKIGFVNTSEFHD